MVRSLLLLALLTAMPAAAQQAPRFGEKIEVKLIEIDVVVTDREGKRAFGLTAGDFEVYEGRARQEITNFTEYRSPERREGSPTTATSATPLPEPRTVLILVDSLPRGGLVRSRVFGALAGLTERMMRPGDRVALVYWEPGFERAKTIVEPTTDRLGALRAFGELAGTTNAVTSSDVTAEQDQFFEEAAGFAASKGGNVDVEGHQDFTKLVAGEGELFLLRRKISGIRRLIGSLAGHQGKKTLLYVSNQFAIPGEPNARLAAVGFIQELVKTANAAGITVYAVRPVLPDPTDPQGLSQADFNRHLDALGRLTQPTGGLLDFGLQSVATVGERMVEDLGSYYSIAYRARSDGSERERRISVRAKNPHYRVRARSSFVEKSNEAMARETLVARLFTGEGGGDLEFQVEQGQAQQNRSNRWLVPIVLRIPVDQLQFEKEGEKQIARVKILIVAANGLAEVTKVTQDELRIIGPPRDGNGFVKYSFQLLADGRGSEISIGVFDTRSGLSGYRTIDLRKRFADDDLRRRGRH